MAGMGLAMAACGAEMGRRAQTQAPSAATQHVAESGEPESAPAPKPTVVVDVDRPFMKWGDPRPDSGRGRMRSEPTRYWTDARVQSIRPALNASTTPATREAIPKPVEPGSRVESAGVVAEPAAVLGK
jgi:hypothetical protein